MRRRRLLAVLGAGVAGSLAGCSGGGGDGGAPAAPTGSGGGPTGTEIDLNLTTATTTDPGDPVGGDAVETLAYDDERDLERIDAGFAQRSVGSFYLAVLPDADAAATLSDRLEHGPAREFLSETEFGSALVVCLQNADGQSDPDIELSGVVRAPDHVELEAGYSGAGGTGDITEDVLLVRVPRGDVDPRQASVAFSNATGEVTRFSTLGRYGDPLPSPRPLVVRNRSCTTHTYFATATVGGELGYQSPGTGRADAATVTRVEDAFRIPGEHELTVRHAAFGGERRVASATVSLSAGDDRGVLFDIAEDGSGSVSTPPVGELPSAVDRTCEEG